MLPKLTSSREFSTLVFFTQSVSTVVVSRLWADHDGLRPKILEESAVPLGPSVTTQLPAVAQMVRKKRP